MSRFRVILFSLIAVIVSLSSIPAQAEGRLVELLATYTATPAHYGLASWSDKHGAAGTTVEGVETDSIEPSFYSGSVSANWSTFRRPIITFDISSLDEYDVNSAHIKMSFRTGESTFTTAIYPKFYPATPANPVSIVAEDYDQFTTTPDTQSAIGSYSSSGWLSYNLTTSGLARLQAAIDADEQYISFMFGYDSDLVSTQAWQSSQHTYWLFYGLNADATKPRLVVATNSPLTVVTNLPIYTNDADVILGGYVTSLGIYSQASAYIEYGFDDTYGGLEFVREVTSLTADGGYYQESFSGFSANQTYHYRAAVKSSDGTWAYGTDKTFTFSETSIFPNITLSRVKNDWEGVIIQTTINPLSYVSGNLSIYYSKDITDLRVSQGYMAGTARNISSSISAASSFQTTFTNLDVGDVYYFRAEYDVTTGLGGVYWSNLLKITINDPDKAGWRNWLDDILSDMGTDVELFWWFIAAVIAGTGVFATIKLQKSWPMIIGIIAACAMLILVSTAFLWLLGLMALAVALFAGVKVIRTVSGK